MHQMPPSTAQQLLSQALAHHQSGNLPQAAQLYQQLLAQNPRHADALRLLGVIAHQLKRHDAAADLLRQAIAINKTIPEYHNDLALALQSLGQLDQAAAACRAALWLNSKSVDFHYNYANILKAQHKLEEAAAEYRHVLALNPDHAPSHNNLGNTLNLLQRPADAVTHYQHAIRIDPANIDARINLAGALQSAGRTADAIEQFQLAIPHRPGDADLHYRFANLLQSAGRDDLAIQHFRQALLLHPLHAPCQNNLGVALQNTGRLSEAAAAFRAALNLDSDFPEAHNNLGNALKKLDEFDAAIAEFRAAIALRPTYAEALSNLGSALKDQALIAESIACFRQAAALKPDSIDLANNLVYMLHFDPNSTPESLAAELAHWNTRFASTPIPSPNSSPNPNHNRNPNPSLKSLRIGWVSPDFRRHPIGRFLLPIFSAHDKTNFPFTCYSDVPAEDELTAQLRSHAQQWHTTIALSHDDLAALIRRDQIDILIDLTMHMQGSRLPVFAEKPAPIQMTYLAYASSTGVPQIDYRLTDIFLDPPGTSSPFVEKPLHLQSYWCYAPDTSAPAVNPLPAATTGTITFGSLNNFCKASPPALAAWIKILRAVPNSQLLLHAPPGSARDRITQLLIDNHLDPARIRFAGLLPFNQYMQMYHQIDIALDPFPYAGGTTSCDALWMGVPLVTLAGNTGVGRSGVRLLSHLSLSEFISSNVDSYISIAAQLASDPARLAHLRATLRDRMQSSLLTNAPRFAADLQSLFRRAWDAQ